MDELQRGTRVVVTSNFPANCDRGVVYDYSEQIVEGRHVTYYWVVFYALEGVGAKTGLYPAHSMQKDTQPVQLAQGDTLEVGECVVSTRSGDLGIIIPGHHLDAQHVRVQFFSEGKHGAIQCFVHLSNLELYKNTKALSIGSTHTASTSKVLRKADAVMMEPTPEVVLSQAGVTVDLPGVTGYTMAVFKASDFPEGTPLHVVRTKWYPPENLDYGPWLKNRGERPANLKDDDKVQWLLLSEQFYAEWEPEVLLAKDIRWADNEIAAYRVRKTTR